MLYATHFDACAKRNRIETESAGRSTRQPARTTNFTIHSEIF